MRTTIDLVKLTPEEEELLKEPLMFYGQQWVNYMKEHHVADWSKMCGYCRIGLIARQVDREAMELDDLLDEQYRKQNPPPMNGSFIENSAYNNTKGMYIRHEVMEQVVLRYRMDEKVERQIRETDDMPM
ncbi:hypothetical protein FACS1894133_5980 [Clostridia bacterium]|nr:hypothetical protein FACS1894133_5980 [Clostridia bacterium]